MRAFGTAAGTAGRTREVRGTSRLPHAARAECCFAGGIGEHICDPVRHLLDFGFSRKPRVVTAGVPDAQPARDEWAAAGRSAPRSC